MSTLGVGGKAGSNVRKAYSTVGVHNEIDTLHWRGAAADQSVTSSDLNTHSATDSCKRDGSSYQRTRTLQPQNSAREQTKSPPKTKARNKQAYKDKKMQSEENMDQALKIFRSSLGNLSYHNIPITLQEKLLNETAASMGKNSSNNRAENNGQNNPY